MTDRDATRWCPHCRRATTNAPLPQMADDVALFDALPGSDEPQGFRRRLYCLECTAIWESLELPREFVKDLLAARVALEEARRQIAMLRFLSAKERQAEQQPTGSMKQQLRLAG